MTLTITSVEAWPVRAPRTKPMISAGGFAPLRVSDFGIVRIRTSDPGVEGLGEISMNNGRDGAIQTDDVKRLLGPALMGSNPLDVRKALVTMDRTMDGSEPAKAAMEMALWDIGGKVAGRPVYDLLGGKVHDRVFIRWGLAFGDPDAGVAEIRPWLDKGVRTIKVKIGRPGTGLDEQMVKAVREGGGDGINVMVDANSGYRTPLQAVQEIQRLEAYNLQLVEQPIHRKRLADLGFIRGHISTPILADESMRHWPDAYDVARHGAADALGIYICEAGGILPALQAAAIGEAAGLVVTIGSQCELGIGTVAMAHAAVCMPNLAFESDITGHLRYPVDIINEQLDYREGAIHPPATPGLGVTLNETVLEQWRLDR
jgi:L-alanine-DL-glutamate epimerase-like enolase superfamily enzyme